MPELIEAETYRQAADRAVGRRISSLVSLDARLLRGACTPTDVERTVVGQTVLGTRRHGKLVLVDLSGGGVVGLHFGMTGRLVVDGFAPIEQLEYSSGRNDPAWDRLVLGFDDGSTLRISDPRRFARVTLNPDVSELGPDAASLTVDQLIAAASGRRGPVKGLLLDQRRVAGIGNLLADESLWRANVAPGRLVPTFDRDRWAALASSVVETIRVLTERGGSHRGDLQAERSGGRCPRCATPLNRATVAGRTTVWCPREQV